MLRMSVLTMMLCFVLLTSVAFAGNDGGAPDSLIVDNIKVTKAGPIPVKIYFANDEELAALTIPLTLKSDGYVIDTVLFEGSRVDYLRMRPITITKDRKSIIFGAICMTEAYIPVGRGLAATLILSKTDKNSSEKCTIDTTTIGPAGVLFSKANSASFIPTFVQGSVVAVDSTKSKEGKK